MELPVRSVIKGCPRTSCFRSKQSNVHTTSSPLPVQSQQNRILCFGTSLKSQSSIPRSDQENEVNQRSNRPPWKTRLCQKQAINLGLASFHSTQNFICSCPSVQYNKVAQMVQSLWSSVFLIFSACKFISHNIHRALSSLTPCKMHRTEWKWDSLLGKWESADGTVGYETHKGKRKANAEHFVEALKCSNLASCAGSTEKNWNGRI